ncbi:MAG: DNA/RNA nuclease SfsA [Methanobacteriaceae archaeon]|nr:DNA/RNA nuclease SfsA [Methanobacteriaceae archaeon]
MKIPNIIQGVFCERPNRFTVIFEKDARIEKAHLHDPGRLKELLVPGASLLLRPAQNPANRKTRYDVIAVESEGTWVLINSGFHSDLAAELIRSKAVPELSAYHVERREYTFGKSRVDFLLTVDEVDNISKKRSNSAEDEREILRNRMLLEVKGCTLVDNGRGRFPDAPTIRGKRHLEELIKAKKQGMNSTVLFLIPREDVEVFSPNWEMDPEFSKTLSLAEKEDVHIIAYSFTVNYQNNELELNPLKRVKVKVQP